MAVTDVYFWSVTVTDVYFWSVALTDALRFILQRNLSRCPSLCLRLNRTRSWVTCSRTSRRTPTRQVPTRLSWTRAKFDADIFPGSPSRGKNERNLSTFPRLRTDFEAKKFLPKSFEETIVEAHPKFFLRKYLKNENNEVRSGISWNCVSGRGKKYRFLRGKNRIILFPWRIIFRSCGLGRERSMKKR